MVVLTRGSERINVTQPEDIAFLRNVGFTEPDKSLEIPGVSSSGATGGRQTGVQTPRPTPDAGLRWNNNSGWYWADPSGRPIGGNRDLPESDLRPGKDKGNLPPGWVDNGGGSADFTGANNADDGSGGGFVSGLTLEQRAALTRGSGSRGGGGRATNAADIATGTVDGLRVGNGNQGSGQQTANSGDQAKYDKIIADWKAGAFGGDIEKVVGAIQDAFGISRNDAVARYDQIRSQITGTGIVGGTGGETPAEVAARLAREQAAAAGGAPPEAFGRYTQYLLDRNLGASGGGPGDEYLRGLFNPTERLFGLEGEFSELTGAAPGTFGDYALRRGGGAGDLYGRAGEILGSLFDAGQTGRTAAFRQLGDLGVDPLTGETRRDVSQDTERDLFGLALRPHLGREGSRFFTRDLGRAQDQFTLSQAQGTNTQSNFADYLRNRYDLGRFFGTPATP